MRTRLRTLLIGALLTFAAAFTAPSARAQAPDRQVISANPFGLLLEFFNAEYERAITGASTAGVGGSFASPDDELYVNGDVFWRYYPQGDPIEGWAFGVKGGVTSFPDTGTYPGIGFDVNRSWLLGEKDNFYVGVGFGLKRLYGTDGDFFNYVPTIRLVNVGIAL